MGCGSSIKSIIQPGDSASNLEDVSALAVVPLSDLADGEKRGDPNASVSVDSTSLCGSARSCVWSASEAAMASPMRVFKDSIASVADVFAAGPHEVCVVGSVQPQSSAIAFAASPPGSVPLADGFEEKVYELSGAEDLATARRKLLAAGMAFSCRRGKKLQPNQDNILLCRSGALTVFGVADGHGDNGHWASQWAMRYASALLLGEVMQAGSVPKSELIFDKVFYFCHEALVLRSAEDAVDLDYSGCTLSLCCIDHVARKVYMAWAGDSSASCSWKTSSAELKVQRLTNDHKATDIQERQRINAAGGHIVSDGGAPRVSPTRGARIDDGPSLAVTRALGDTAMASCGVTSTPAHRLVDNLSAEEPGFVVCCSDGVWDFLSHDAVAEIVHRNGREQVDRAVDEIVEGCRERWLERDGANGDSDDISAVIAWL